MLLNRSIALLLRVSMGGIYIFTGLKAFVVVDTLSSFRLPKLSQIWPQLPRNSCLPPSSYAHCTSTAKKDPFFIQNAEKLYPIFPIRKPLQGQVQGPAQNSPYWWNLPWPGLGGSYRLLSLCRAPLWHSHYHTYWGHFWNISLSH